MNLPNKLTVLRVIMIPFFVFFYLTGHVYIADILFIIGQSDRYGRRQDCQKIQPCDELWKVYGIPLADKLLVAAALICFVEVNRIPAWDRS